MIQILHHQGKRKFLYKMRCSLIFHIWRMRILLWCLSQTDAEGNGILPSRRDIKLRTLRVSAQVLSQESDSQEWGTVGNSGWHAYPLLSAICDSTSLILSAVTIPQFPASWILPSLSQNVCTGSPLCWLALQVQEEREIMPEILGELHIIINKTRI